MGRRDGRSTDIQCLVLANLDRTLGSQKETEMYKMLLINCRTISRTHYNKDKDPIYHLLVVVLHQQQR